MKRYILDFMRRGVTACGFGPLILAVIYLILRQNGIVQMLTVEEVCLGIFTLSALAFSTSIIIPSFLYFTFLFYHIKTNMSN